MTPLILAAASLLLIVIGAYRLFRAHRAYRVAQAWAAYRAACLPINAARALPAGQHRAGAREWGRAA